MTEALRTQVECYIPYNDLTGIPCHIYAHSPVQKKVTSALWAIKSCEFVLQDN